MQCITRFFLLLLFPLVAFAQDNIVNVYAWSGELPDSIIQQFEKETGIRVNLSTYENNEIMYAKLRASKQTVYDVIIPSSGFVDRMRRRDMLEPLDKSKLPNWKNIDPAFLNPSFDPQSQYSAPFFWGVTGIFVNRHDHSHTVKKWADLWDDQYANQLLLLDDTRDVFSITLILLGYSANDNDPDHIKAAYLKLKKLMRNVKVFSTDTVTSIMIDEDATIGVAWNGDTYKASKENPHITFIYPEEGFSIWVDNFSIPKNAPHREAAYTFINFILRPDIAKTIALYTGYPTANLAGRNLLPAHIRNNPMIYPSPQTLRRGQFITDVSEEAITLYEKYWEELKMHG